MIIIITCMLLPNNVNNNSNNNNNNNNNINSNNNNGKDNKNLSLKEFNKNNYRVNSIGGDQKDRQHLERTSSRHTSHVKHTHRIFYCNQETRTASWLPPPELWCGTSLPYGWEQAIDPDGKPYYINHITKSTTYEDPRTEYEEDQNSKPRLIELSRDSELGFGFVAGSEKPVVVRYVIEGGPSEGKLLPGDLILAINEDDVQNTAREQVIQMVRNCPNSVKLKVRQPPLDTSAKKSALLSSAKKERLKTNPSRVRFAEGVIVNGSTVSTPFSGGESSCPPIPNILKVFLENGQTKSFKYDNNTKVKDVLQSLKNKLCIQAINHFALVLEQVKGLRRNKLTLLNPDHTIARIASRPGAHNLRCLFRVAFVPKDACILAQEDLIAFEYLYMQCCNDVVQERYAPELKYDTALRLAALHIHQHAISNNIPYNKITVKSIEKEFGLDKFVPVSLMESMKRKELRKLLTHLLKLNQTITGTTHKTLTSLQAKLYYLTIIAELPSYGAKCFSTNIRECNVETVILISPKVGISQIIGTRNSMPAQIAEIEHLDGVRVQANDQITSFVTLYIPSVVTKVINFTIEDRDAEELVLVLKGYYRLFTGRELPVSMEKEFWMQDAAPTYHMHHMVLPAPWSYTSEIDHSQHRYADFSIPPMYTNSDQLNILNGKNFNSSQFKVCNNGNRDYDRKQIYDDRCNAMMADQNGYLLNKRLSNPNELKDIQSVLSMEMLQNSNNPYIESRNREVIRRVTEMQELVQNSEQYLSQHTHEFNASDGSHICPLELENNNVSHSGQLKHSDSLLLLTQGQQEMNNRFYEAMEALQMGDVESDTDSVSTPSGSPSRTSHNFNRDSGTSFGLHSPDSVSTSTQHTLQDLWMKMRDSNSVSDDEYLYHFEPDVIDLTLIPPPDKVDDDDECDATLVEPEAPPPAAFTDDHLSSISEQQQRHDRLLDSVLCGGLDNNQLMSLDLDSFLATMTVPPPTPNLTSDSELTSEQISSFIIPPPPMAKDETNDAAMMKERKGEKEFDDNSLTLSKNARNGDVKTVTDNSNINKNNDVNSNNSNNKNNDNNNNNPMASISNAEDCTPSSSSSVTSSAANRNCSTLPSRNKSRGRNGPPSIPPRIDSLNSLSRKNSSTTFPAHQNSNSRPACSKEAVQSIQQLKDEHNEILAQCNKAQSCGGGNDINETKFQEAVQELSDEARQLVTSSKSLVKSYMEPNCPNFGSNLFQCISQLKVTTELCNRLIAHTASPLQTRNLIQKVADVVNTFHEFIANVTDNSETEVITKYAEGLANVLATLLRSLRIFSP